MIKAVVTDIEGTTSSISFVKEVLFPYARGHIGDFVHRHAADEDVAPLIEDVRDIIGGQASLDDVITQLIQWIDEDKKITPLKAIQGLIWERGYNSRDFFGHMYDDAVEELRDWKNQGIDIYVYSSGSVYAQKLLFGHTEYGDLTPLFKGYFDTRIGAKNDKASYDKIVEALDAAPDEIAFLSDITEELDAARAAGMQTICLVRDNEVDKDAVHRQVKDFHAIRPLLTL